MKRLLYILTCILAIGAVHAIPAPDNFLPQRVETTVTGPIAQGAEGRIIFTAGNTDVTFNVYSITGQLVKVVRVSADQKVPQGVLYREVQQPVVAQGGGALTGRHTVASCCNRQMMGRDSVTSVIV